MQSFSMLPMFLQKWYTIFSWKTPKSVEIPLEHVNNDIAVHWGCMKT